MRIVYTHIIGVLLILLIAPVGAIPGFHINDGASAKRAVQQYGENNFQFEATCYQAALDKNLWRLALAAHDYLREKPEDPVRECSFAQAYWKSQQAGVSETIPSVAAKQLQGLFEEAVLDTKDAVKRMPTSIYAHLTYGHYLQYYALMDKSNIPIMISEYKRAVSLAPKSGYAHYQLALGYFGSGNGNSETINKIISEAKKAVALDPRLTDSYFWIACVYSWPGQPDYRISSLYLDKYLQAQPQQANRLDVVSLKKYLKDKLSS